MTVSSYHIVSMKVSASGSTENSIIDFNGAIMYIPLIGGEL
jgi:hypothetical protein